MEKIVGICYAYDIEDGYEEILSLGFKWTRMEICFPWKDKMFGTLSEAYQREKEEIRKAKEAGMLVMPSTPGMGGYFYDPDRDETYYHDAWPAFVGEKATEEYFRKSGISHILVVSGMHINIIVIISMYILLALKVGKGKTGMI